MCPATKKAEKTKKAKKVLVGHMCPLLLMWGINAPATMTMLGVLM